MTTPRAFLSFDFDNDLFQKNLFSGQASRDSPTPFVVEDWSSKESLPQGEWEQKISQKIANCHLLIVLVGRHMTTAVGVAKEITMARERNVPIFGVYVDGAGPTSSLPPGLSRNRTIRWTWPGIASAIRVCMSEGKNG